MNAVMSARRGPRREASADVGRFPPATPRDHSLRDDPESHRTVQARRRSEPWRFVIRAPGDEAIAAAERWASPKLHRREGDGSREGVRIARRVWRSFERWWRANRLAAVALLG
jgi:hypothetical protein